MTNLTETILKSSALLSTTDITTYIDFVKFFVFKNSFNLDWDKDDGEEWGRVTSGNELILIFCARLPLVFVQTKHVEQLNKDILIAKVPDIMIITVEDWDAKLYSVDVTAIASCLPWHSCIPSEQISINDLWYATI